MDGIKHDPSHETLNLIKGADGGLWAGSSCWDNNRGEGEAKKHSFMSRM